MISIRRRLLATLLSMFTVAWVLLGALSFINAKFEIEELFDAELAQSGRVLMSLTLHELEEEQQGRVQTLPEVVPDYKLGHHYEKKIAFQIFQKNRLLLQSPSAPATMAHDEPGLSDQRIGEAVWRVFVLHDRDLDVRIVVAERDDLRDDLIHKIAWQTLLPIVVTLPLLALLIWSGVGRGLAPLQRVARDIGRRSPQQLTPLSAADIPKEVQPLANALNDLLERLRQAFERERRFTADAAHELRTPLAGLKAQAQVALRESNDALRREALAQIVHGVDRATHLVAQLLTMARLDPDMTATIAEEIDLVALAAEVIGELAPTATEKNITVGIAEGSAGVLRGQRAAIRILLRNLIDNAIRYTLPRGEVDVAVHAANGNVLLSVRDTGPGIPADERARVFDRFFRGGANVSEGCGLGLSIVKRIAELHHATIALDAPATGTGLVVRVQFPRRSA